MNSDVNRVPYSPMDRWHHCSCWRHLGRWTPFLFLLFLFLHLGFLTFPSSILSSLRFSILFVYPLPHPCSPLLFNIIISLPVSSSPSYFLLHFPPLFPPSFLISSSFLCSSFSLHSPVASLPLFFFLLRIFILQFLLHPQLTTQFGLSGQQKRRRRLMENEKGRKWRQDKRGREE